MCRANEAGTPRAPDYFSLKLKPSRDIELQEWLCGGDFVKGVSLIFLLAACCDIAGVGQGVFHGKFRGCISV